MVKNPYPGGNPGGVLKNNGGPKAGKRSDQGVVGMPSKSYAPGPDRNMGNSQNTSSDNAYAKELLASDTRKPDKSGRFFK